MANDAAWITRYRDTTTGLINVLDALVALRQQYDALDYGNTLTPEDFVPQSADIDLPQLVAAVGSVEALYALFQSGHDTNLYRIKL